MKARITACIPVWSGGYHLATYRGKRDDPRGPGIQKTYPELDEEHPEQADEKDRTYDPFIDHPALFHVAARLEPTDEAIVGFITQYGDLFERPYVSTFHPISDYREALAVIRWGVDLWEAIESKDENHASKFVEWNELRPTTRYVEWIDGPDGIEVLGRWDYSAVLPFGGADKYMKEGSPTEGLYRYKPPLRKGQNLAACRHFLESLIAYHIQRPPSDHFMLAEEGEAIVEVRINELNTVLWFELSQVVVGEVELRHCLQCGKPFILRKSTRSDRVFCNQSCKVINLQRRKKRALEMRAEGKSVRQIAKEAGAPNNSYQQNLKTIHRWLAGEEE